MATKKYWKEISNNHREIDTEDFPVLVDPKIELARIEKEFNDATDEFVKNYMDEHEYIYTSLSEPMPILSKENKYTLQDWLMEIRQTTNINRDLVKIICDYRIHPINPYYKIWLQHASEFNGICRFR